MVRRRPARPRRADRRRLRIGARPWGDDAEADSAAAVEDVRLGRLAAYVRDKRIPLEMCPEQQRPDRRGRLDRHHPIGLLCRLHFRVTVNTDNRLMSGTSMSREMGLLVSELGWTLDDLQWVTINAMKSAFIPFDERLAHDRRRDQAGVRRAGLRTPVDVAVAPFVGRSFKAPAAGPKPGSWRRCGLQGWP